MKDIEKKILESLAHDGRAPLSRISSKIKVAKHRIDYYIKKMVKEGLILKYRMSINYEPLGYNFFIIYLEIQRFSEVRDKVLKFIEAFPNTFYCSEVFPYLNLKIEIISKDVREVESFVNEIESICDGRLVRRETTQTMQILKDFRFCTDRLDERHGKKITLDAKDKKLLLALQENPISKLKDLSFKTGLSIEGVRLKIKKMKESKLLRRVTIEYNKEKMGGNFWGQIVMRINSFDKIKKEFVQRIHDIDAFGRVRQLYGRWNLEADILVNNFQELQGLIEILEDVTNGEITDYHIMAIKKNHIPVRVPQIVLNED